MIQSAKGKLKLYRVKNQIDTKIFEIIKRRRKVFFNFDYEIDDEEAWFIFV